MEEAAVEGEKASLSVVDRYGFEIDLTARGRERERGCSKNTAQISRIGVCSYVLSASGGALENGLAGASSYSSRPPGFEYELIDARADLGGELEKRRGLGARDFWLRGSGGSGGRA